MSATNPLENHDPFLVEIGKMLDPGRWWSEGPVGYVASMYDSRSFEDRAVSAVKNAERLVLRVADAIANKEALPAHLENAIDHQINNAIAAAQETFDRDTEGLRDQIETLQTELEAARKPKASSFLDLAGVDIDPIEEDNPAFGSNPLMGDLLRAGPLTPKRDVALVDIGPEPSPASGFGGPVLKEHPAASQPFPHLITLVAALRRAQYTAEPLGFEINTNVRMHPQANKDESIATIELTVTEDRVTRETVWLDPDRPTDKYEQVFAIVQAAAKDVGRHITKLNR